MVGASVPTVWGRPPRLMSGKLVRFGVDTVPSVSEHSSISVVLLALAKMPMDSVPDACGITVCVRICQPIPCRTCP